MASRPRLNEYFIDKSGISREVIQADICRYLGNDALVRPGEHEGRQGYFIRAYRNLTSEMIADLKTDSNRWEADKQRRDLRPESYSTHHEPREPSYPTNPPYADPAYGRPPTTYSSAPTQPAYGGYTQPSNYPSVPAYSTPPGGFVPAPAAPPVTAPEMASSYTYSGNNGYPYPDRSGAAAPRGYPVYDQDPDYPPGVSSGMAYPPTTAPDPRISPMEGYGHPGRAPPRDPHRQPR